jgi:hypothetical protein
MWWWFTSDDDDWPWQQFALQVWNWSICMHALVTVLLVPKKMNCRKQGARFPFRRRIWKAWRDWSRICRRAHVYRGNGVTCSVTHSAPGSACMLVGWIRGYPSIHPSIHPSIVWPILHAFSLERAETNNRGKATRHLLPACPAVRMDTTACCILPTPEYRDACRCSVLAFT